MPKSYIPTFISLLSVLSSIFAIKHSIYGEYSIAIQFIIFSCILDGLDGFVARKLNSVSTFGGQIDSLCDVCAFGFAPAMCAYFWALSDFKTLGWLICFLIVSSLIIRLARFNTMQILNQKIYNNIDLEKYFIGVPAPAVGILMMLPIGLITYVDINFCNIEDIEACFYSLNNLLELKSFKICVLVYYICIAYFSVSRVPFPKQTLNNKVLLLSSIIAIPMFIFYPIILLITISMIILGFMIYNIFISIVK